MSSKKPKTINPDEVDPSVYYYDEVYDEMKEDGEGQKDKRSNDSAGDKPRTSKYIQGLKETADLRKTEKELRRFKKYTRDKEDSRHHYHDDDVYITEGYKKKLKEMKVLEEDRRKRLEYEKDNTMNFLKKFKGDKSKDSDDSKEKEHHPQFSDNNPSQKQNQDSTSEILTVNDNQLETQGPQIIQSKKELKTFQDRREHLRKVLAKRTVGVVFEEAVKRYKDRKASAKL